MSNNKENANNTAQLPPALRSWIENVIVPAMVKIYLAELKKAGATPEVSTARVKEAIQELHGELPHQVLKDKKMLTVAEAADCLGLSQATIRAWIANRRLTYVRLGRAIRIPSEAIRTVIENGIVPEKRRS